MSKFSGIINKYKSLSPAVKASFWFTICSLLQKGLAFITVPIFTRIMTTEEYGYVTLYQSWLGVITIICTLNITYGGFFNGMVKYKEDKNGYTSSVLFLTTVMTVVWYVIYILTNPITSSILGLSNNLVTLMFIEIISKAAYDVWITRQKYEFNYKIQTIVTITCAIFTPVLGIALVLNMQDKVLGRIISFVAVYVILGVVLYFSMLNKSKNICCLEYWKFSLSFCIPLIPHFLAQTLLSQSDRIMINNMVGTSEAAIYGFSYNISMVLIIVYQAINNSFIPWLYQKMEVKSYNDINKTVQPLLLLIAVLTAIVTLFAPEAVIILGGTKYYEAVYIIPPVIDSVFFMFLYSVFFNVEAYFEKNKFAMVASVIAAILNLILNYIFIPVFGYIAAGYTTVICYIVLSIAHYVCMKQVCKEKGITNGIYDVKPIAIMGACLIIFAVLSTVLYAYTFLRHIVIIVLLIFMIAMKNKIINVVKVIKKK